MPVDDGRDEENDDRRGRQSGLRSGENEGADRAKKKSPGSYIQNRRRQKRNYQQGYRDRRQGLPDNRRIAAAVMAVLLENEANRPSAAFDQIDEAAIKKLAREYSPEITRSIIKALRDAAYDKVEDAKARRENPIKTAAAMAIIFGGGEEGG